MPMTETARVGLITSDEKANAGVTDPGADTKRLFRDYAREAQKLAANGAQAIVMPEKLGVTLEGKTAETDAVLQSVAAQTERGRRGRCAWTVSEVQRRGFILRAQMYNVTSAAHVAPFSEPEAGNDPTTAAATAPEVGCGDLQDMDFARPPVFGEAGTGLILVQGGTSWSTAVGLGTSH
jgi:apolipoprotein N-acyltransferase